MSGARRWMVLGIVIGLLATADLPHVSMARVVALSPQSIMHAAQQHLHPVGGKPGAMVLGAGPRLVRVGLSAGVSGGTAPASVDLTAYDPPVGDQGQLNSCVSWATGYYMRGWLANKYQSTVPDSFAPMYVYAQIDHGQNQGTTFSANLTIEKNQGIDLWDDYSQGPFDNVTQPTSAETTLAGNYKLATYSELFQNDASAGTPGTANGGLSLQTSIENSIANGFPVMILIPIYPNFDNASSSNPVVDVPSGGSSRGWHAVFAPKYDSTGLWIENQWGTSWGQNGYAELTWAFIEQYVVEAWTATVASAPLPTPPPTATAVPTTLATPGVSPNLSISIPNPPDNSTVLRTVPVIPSITLPSYLTAQKIVFKIDSATRATVTKAPWTWNWDTTHDSVGAHTVSAILYDSSGNSIGATNNVTLTDWIAPTISLQGARSGGIYHGSLPLSLSFHDNVVVSSWGLEANVVTGTYLITSSTLAHPTSSASANVAVNTAAFPDGHYGIVVTATDATSTTPSLDNLANTTPLSVTFDNTAPTLATGGITNSESVSNTIVLSATASDATSGIKSVTVSFDGKPGASMSPSGNVTLNGPNAYRYSWATLPFTVGQHIVTFAAMDNAGNVTTAAYTVTEPDWVTPTVKLSGPRANTDVRGTIPLSLSMSDNTAVTSWGLIARGVTYTVPLTSAQGISLTTLSLAYAWNTTAITSDGVYGLILTATDAAGNLGSTPVVSLTVDNVPPVLSSGGITNGESVSGTIPLTATVSDDLSGVSKAQIIFDGHTTVNMAPQGAATASGPNNYAYSWNTSTYTVGTHTVDVLATDLAGNVVSTTYTVSEPDWITPTVKLSGLHAGSDYRGVVPLTFNLSDNTGVVTYALRALSGTTVISSALTSASALSTTNRAVTYNWDTANLPDGAYALELTAADSSGNVGTSGPYALTIDNTAPTLSSGGISAGMTVSHTVTITASATDATSGIKSTQVIIDGRSPITMSPQGAVTALGPDNYIYAWNTTTYTVGQHLVKVLVTDNAGNVISSTTTVTEPDWILPVVGSTAPGSGAFVAGVVAVAGTSSDNVGVLTDTVLITGTGTGSSGTTGTLTQAHTGSNVSRNWTTTGGSYPDGQYAVQLSAVDAAGNVGYSTARTVTVDNTPPTVTIGSLAGTISGTVTLNLTVSDPTPSDGAIPSGVQSTKILVDGTVVATLAGSTSTWRWSTKTVADGSHTLTAQVTDKAGNTATSSAVTTTIAN